MPRKILTTILLFASFAGALPAQAPLSTIQDVLFKADGARFTGTLVIHWNTFDANNLGTVAQQSRTVSVLNGNLQIRLAPNATAQPPANLYTVAYQSDGREQFTELWAVPVASQPLTVPQVRVGTVASGAGGGSTSAGGAGNATPIVESSVIGLLSDLAQRPTKGPGFGTNAVAVINSSGQVETAVGVLGDCVLVDGTTAPCGSGTAATFIDTEVPGGTINDTNSTFTLVNAPSGQSLALYRNGVYLTAGSDYNLTGSTIVFINSAQPRSGDSVVASYRLDPAANIGQLQQSNGNVSLAQVICSGPGISTGGHDWASLGACDIPANSLRAGDRLEVRFSYSKTGTETPWDVSLEWGSANILTRHASAQDSAFTGKAEAAMTVSGAQISLQSWGTVLTFLPGIVNAPVQSGLRVDFRGKLSVAGTGAVVLSNFTVLRYPRN